MKDEGRISILDIRLSILDNLTILFYSTLTLFDVETTRIYMGQSRQCRS